VFGSDQEAKAAVRQNGERIKAAVRQAFVIGVNIVAIQGGISAV
jgi:hypothetical protein